ncbi:hypothetical protein J699_01231 [Acinetobacter sp. 1000160]|nr:hypothetical protein J522_0459 [Acinetobacter baumannii 146457]EYT22531.1 hypothetical protein J699_01231 [Acinetobacter sp. 1000160]
MPILSTGFTGHTRWFALLKSIKGKAAWIWFKAWGKVVQI